MACNKNLFICEASRYFRFSDDLRPLPSFASPTSVRCTSPWYHFVRVNLRLEVTVLVDEFDLALTQLPEIIRLYTLAPPVTLLA
jgi:hypothetical protein